VCDVREARHKGVADRQAGAVSFRSMAPGRAWPPAAVACPCSAP